jgi:aspartyl-tRNA(Asn)/glutamyl-tRNA(Gln) amidotransferase subunit A
MNVHYGTPRSPYQRGSNGPTDGYVPGGSSSGAAVSVSDGMAWAGIGSDTGGSTRIPAAFCGLVGFKPTSHRIPREGAIPLSTTLDSIGPIARTVADCHAVDAILAGMPYRPLRLREVAHLRFAVPTTGMLEGLDVQVAAAFARALDQLGRAGAVITEIAVPEFDAILASYRRGTFASFEAYAWHRERLAKAFDQYDWRVAKRLKSMSEGSAADYLALHADRLRLQQALADRLRGFDAMLSPTTPIVPARIDALEADAEAFFRVQPQTVRNCQLYNFANRPALSVPMHRPDEPPMGLMIAGHTDQDGDLFEIGASVATALSA